MGILNMLSAGVAVNEIDLTGIIPAVSTSVGAYVGQFTWGPCSDPRLINDESMLVGMFGEPDATTWSSNFAADSFFSCANFLAYTTALYVVRVVDPATANNSCETTANLCIQNENAYEQGYLYLNNSNTYGAFAAKYPGVIGNSLKVDICDHPTTFSNWKYNPLFENAPGTSSYMAATYGNTSANDELHVIVTDAGGRFTGVANSILERFSYVSKAKDAINSDGQANYWKTNIFQNSNYVYAMDPPDYSNTSVTWGQAGNSTVIFGRIGGANATANSVYSARLKNGADGSLPSNGQIETGWTLFTDKDKYEISLAFTGSSNTYVCQWVFDNIIVNPTAETPVVGRKDTMLFVSPRYADVVNQYGQEVNNIVTNATSWLNIFNRASSYIVADSGWKYQYDRYNNMYRWVPLNADIAGLCAQTDQSAETWYSPAGYNRGILKNVVKLAWSPNQSQRDALYVKGINPVITQTGVGVVLLGDKTMQSKPSAFDRINVRRLFIVLEKAISRAAKYMLFEFNDQFTRAQFVAMVEPYLRTIKGKRGIYDFKVVCDETNNTPDIIDRNAFVGDIYIKPARSINFIQLNFVAVKTGVDFNTVIGQW
jgi:phage tail sheath protein FI